MYDFYSFNESKLQSRQSERVFLHNRLRKASYDFEHLNKRHFLENTTLLLLLHCYAPKHPNDMTG